MRLYLPDHGGGGGAVPGGVSAPPLPGGAGPHKQEHNLHLTRPGGRCHRLPAEVRGGHTGKLLQKCGVALSLCSYVPLSLMSNDLNEDYNYFIKILMNRMKTQIFCSGYHSWTLSVNCF